MSESASGNPAEKRPRLSVKKKIIFAIVILVVIFVILEIAARLSDAVRGVDPTTRLLARLGNYRAHPNLNVMLRPGAGGANSLGFRGAEIAVPKPAGRIRIACLGGSTTYGHALRAEKAYPAQLERILRERFPGRAIEVINAGVPTHHTLSMLINFQCRVLPLEPDIICVYESAIDMWPIMTHGFKSDYTHFYRDFPDDRVFDAAAGTNWFIKILECSRVYQILRYRFTDFRRRGELAYYMNNYGRDEWGVAKEVNEEGVKNFERNLRTIAAAAKEHGVAVVLGTFAFRKSIVPTSAQGECYNRMNAVMREVAEKHGIPVAEVNAAVADNADNYTNDDIHLSAKGSELQAKAFADAIVAARLMENK